MQEMLELFTKGADVCLTVNTDEICSACPNNCQGLCEAAEKVKRYDNAVLSQCGLTEGQTLPFSKFTQYVQQNIIASGKHSAQRGRPASPPPRQDQPIKGQKTRERRSLKKKKKTNKFPPLPGISREREGLFTAGERV